MDLQRAFGAAGVVNEAQLPEAVHKEADARTSCPDHLGQSFLADLGNYSFRNAFLAKMREQQQHAGQPLFAGVEKLVDKIFLVTADQPAILRQKSFPGLRSRSLLPSRSWIQL